ncbi:hypothetical protein A5845_001340, partial [Enterococcus faecium]
SLDLNLHLSKAQSNLPPTCRLLFDYLELSHKLTQSKKIPGRRSKTSPLQLTHNVTLNA